MSISHFVTKLLWHHPAVSARVHNRSECQNSTSSPKSHLWPASSLQLICPLACRSYPFLCPGFTLRADARDVEVWCRWEVRGESWVYWCEFAWIAESAFLWSLDMVFFKVGCHTFLGSQSSCWHIWKEKSVRRFARSTLMWGSNLGTATYQEVGARKGWRWGLQGR